MHTMQPAIIRGRFEWDNELLPIEESEGRVERLQREMQSAGLGSVLVFGNSAEYADLCYFTNYIPHARWAVAIVPSTGEPTLLVRAGERDLHFAKSLTWVGDVRTVEGLAAQIQEVLDGTKSMGGKAAQVGGLERVPESVYNSAVKGAGGQIPVDATKLVWSMRLRKSSRELRVMRAVRRIAVDSVGEIAAAHGKGLANDIASIAGERAALAEGVQDVRIMVNGETGPILRPPRGSLRRSSEIMVYLAAEYQGYWADATLFAGTRNPLQERCAAVLQQLIRGIRDGTVAGLLAEEVDLGSDGATMLQFFENSLGNGIGLSLCEEPTLSAGSDFVFREGMTLALHVGLTDNGTNHGLASEVVVVGKNGCEVV